MQARDVVELVLAHPTRVNFFWDAPREVEYMTHTVALLYSFPAVYKATHINAGHIAFSQSEGACGAPRPQPAAWLGVGEGGARN